MKRFLIDIFRVWRNEFRLIKSDIGVLVFLFLLPLSYPIIYSAIYNPELVRDVPVVVVDDSRTALTRKYARHLDASQYVEIAGYAANMHEARRAMAEKNCYGIVHFPGDFSAKAGRGETATLEVFCDMSLLLRYKAVFVAVTDVASAMGADVLPVPFKLVPVGNVSQGLASAVLPGILVLILQQCIILAICFMGVASRERARAAGGRDPRQVNAGVVAMLLGKSMCYIVLILVPMVFLLHFVPIIFSFPMNGDVWSIMAFFVPFLFAVIFFGMTFQWFIPDREATFLVFVFTSLVFVFLSGISWPRYAMSGFWQLLSDCLPSTWGVIGFVGLNTDGATLEQQCEPYCMLWTLAMVYFITALVTTHHRNVTPPDRA